MIFFTMVEENFEIWSECLKRFNFTHFEWYYSPWFWRKFWIWWAECLQNTLISDIFIDILNHGWRNFWNLSWMLPKLFNFTLFQWYSSRHGSRKFWNLTWKPPKRFNFTHFQWYSSPWLKKILKFDDLNASKTL